jgi:hypothetical protein
MAQIQFLMSLIYLYPGTFDWALTIREGQGSNPGHVPVVINFRHWCLFSSYVQK